MGKHQSDSLNKIETGSLPIQKRGKDDPSQYQRNLPAFDFHRDPRSLGIWENHPIKLTEWPIAIKQFDIIRLDKS